MLTYDDKVAALALIRAIGFSKAVHIFSRSKRVPAPTMRETLDELHKTHYLLDDGFVEVTFAGVLQYVEFGTPTMPQTLSQEYFDTCKLPKQEAFNEALSCLGAGLRKFKPYVITKKVTAVTKQLSTVPRKGKVYESLQQKAG